MKSFLKLLGLVLCCMLLVQMGAQQSLAEVELSPEQLAQLEADLADESKELPVGEAFRVTVKPNDLSVTEGLDEQWLNILLLGTDTGDLRLNYGRTDAMMVLSIHKVTGSMKLTSLVRDMLVDIPGFKIQNRINTANAFGGPLLAVKTVNEVLQLNITHYVSINFTGFKDVVDDLGGVHIQLSNAEAGIAGARISDQPQLLTGEQALEYVRIRSLDNNFGRNERQRKFLAAVLEQVKASGFDQIMEAITSGFRSVATNLSTSEVVALLPAMVRNSEDLQTLSLPLEREYRFATTPAGASVVEFELADVREAIGAFVYGEHN